MLLEGGVIGVAEEEDVAVARGDTWPRVDENGES